jgi:long-chain acyl-CoA synthetase
MKPVWLKSYQTGVPETINPDTFTSLNAMFEWIFDKYKEHPAFTNMGIQMTYAQVDESSRHFAAYLQKQLGIKKGDRFAIMMPNILQYPIAIIGALRAGAIVVNVNILQTPEEFSRQMQDSGAIGLLVLENFAHIPAKVIKDTQIKHVIVTKISDVLTGSKAMLVDFVLKYVKRKVPRWHFKTYTTYKDAMKIGATLQYEKIPITNDDIALLQYTGGTTGAPKGAMITQRNLQSIVLQMTAWMSTITEPGNEIVVTVLPIFHIAAFVSGVLVFMYNGGLNILITNPLDTKGFVREVKPFKFTMMPGVNRLFNALLNEPEFAGLDFSRAKLSVSSGMSVQPVVAQRWNKITHSPLLQAYSMTETSLAITCNPFHLKDINGTVGLPLPSTELSIHNDLGDELDIDYPGEIWVRGPQVMKGYWNNEAETNKVLTKDGWFKTGDVGIIDEKGFLKIIDRKKDVIYIFGFQVFPSEVEEVINSMPQVKESCVIDAYDEVYGEIVKAFVVPSDPKLTVEQVIKYCQDNLLYYKVPKVIEFRAELPKNVIGKILRRSLRSSSI